MPKGLLAALVLAACDTGIHEIPGAVDAGSVSDAPPSACEQATHHSDYAWIRDNVFARHCSFSTACHKGSRPRAGLDLTAEGAFADLVGVKSSEEPQLLRVNPGHPDSSYLMIKLGTFPGPIRTNESLMPPNSPPICVEKQQAVQRWIEQGALAEPIVDGGVSD